MIVNSKIEKTWHGTLNLVYAKRQDSTQLIYNHNQAPLKIQRPFYPEGKEICHSIILHTAGGVVGGDKLTSQIHLQPHSQVLITTAAANKIYRSNGLQARQNINIQINAGAYLEYLPQETIIFNGAVYRQDVRIELDEKASFLGWEITRLGRTARGEKFVQGEMRSHTEIWRNNQPLWIDRQIIPGNEQIFHSPHGLGGNPVIGTLVFIGVPISQEIIEQARSLITQSMFAGVTRLEYGLLCRYRGNSTSEVRKWFTNIWQMLRVSCLNRGNCIPRVWQM
ncbi:urease accessory protein UreD [Sphaerospermopsis aphanizomenoides BCCUSP55]|uniref:urease accessory protein UreD n=1 Tax=Sphaerospermopsis aphanizomenoides TaxID=459663 RepID=UPI0019048189|nr:urease accessory protein UreD [Sphaerospermopsis aphanizomenoides]MBK1987952.1 urease accessory protein UreD [Sphaerospermopsis aphanizomenoides BCCUSP55]